MVSGIRLFSTMCLAGLLARPCTQWYAVDVMALIRVCCMLPAQGRLRLLPGASGVCGTVPLHVCTYTQHYTCKQHPEGAVLPRRGPRSSEVLAGPLHATTARAGE
jgi:hypothetical protein